jgi:solute carrier family 35 protein E1
MMCKGVLVLACLFSVVDGRRVQSANERLANLQSDDEQVEKSDSAQSFVEVKAAWSPASLIPNGLAPRTPSVSHGPARFGPATVDNTARVMPPSMTSIAASGDFDGMKPEIEKPKDLTIDILPTETQKTVAESLKQKEVEDSVEVSVAAKEPWYGNLRMNALILVLAKIFARIALSFRSRLSTKDASETGTRHATVTMSEGGETKKGFLSGVDVPLLTCFVLWYLGNYYYNITNKLALNAAGGAAGFPMTIATLQLGVGVIYALCLWLAPDARKKPKITWQDYKATLPVGFTAAGAHAASVFALSAGAVSFAQIVKAAEPAFAAVLGSLFYGASVSTAKWLCLVPVIGGVIMASLGELSFAWAALGTAAIANVFAAVKANENKKLMDSPGLKDRIGSVGNQFALTTINAFLFCLPVMFLTEGRKLGAFWELCKTTPVVLNNMVFSGLWFYLYNELATLTIKKTGAVTQSVANTAKRVIVIIVVALVMGESLGALKLIGCGIGIGGVFLYSIIDKLVGKKNPPPAAASS